MRNRLRMIRRANRAEWRYYQQTVRVTSELVARHGSFVQGGPFAGLRLPTEAYWGNRAPLLVGSYEAELHDVIEELIETRPRQIVNVGCAEGYYAVGLARRLPDTEVYAFDIQERAQQLTLETAQLNGVAQQVHVAGACTVERLEQLLGMETLLIVDCEGCELGLLRPERAPSLRAATLLVELHDFIDPQISSVILARFRGTHSTRVVGVRQRTITEYPVLQELAAPDRALALDELRTMGPPMWVILCPYARFQLADRLLHSSRSV
jgi:Methyltransferase small domain